MPETKNKGKEKSEEIDDKEALERAYNANYGYFLIWGGLYDLKRSWPFAVAYLISCGIHIPLFGYTAYLFSDDLGIMAEALHFVVLLWTTCFGIWNYYYYEQHLTNIYKLLGRGCYKYETLNKECVTTIASYRRDVDKTKEMYTKTFASIIMLAVVTISVGRPLARYFLTDIKNLDSIEEFDGINRYSVVDCWYPLDSRRLDYYLLCTGFQYILVYVAPGIALGNDITFLCFCEELCLQLRILKLTLSNAYERAIDLQKQSSDADKNLVKSSDSIKKYLNLCLRDSIRHHYFLLKFFDDLVPLYSMALLVVFITATFMLCLSGFIFTSDSVGLMSKLTFLAFLLAESVHTFIFCYYGEQSGQLGESLYSGEWIQESDVFEPYLIMVPTKSIRPMELNALGFMTASLDTYGKILKSSYSYFNLLSAVR